MDPRLLARKCNNAWKPQKTRNTYGHPEMVRSGKKMGNRICKGTVRKKGGKEGTYRINDYSRKDGSSHCFSVIGVFGRADQSVVVTLKDFWSACGLLLACVIHDHDGQGIGSQLEL